MTAFIPYLKTRLTANGYLTVKPSANVNDLLAVTPDNKKVWIAYLDAPIEVEQIRRSFEFVGHVLYVVDEKLIPDQIESREKTPQWLRVLHGLYMGRIYVWNGKYLFGLHFDYDTGDISESASIHPDGLILEDAPTWLKGWSGNYRTAKFSDRAWWTGGAQRSDYRRQEPPRNAYENTWTPPDPPYGDWTASGSSSKQSYEQARKTWSEQTADDYRRQQAEREQKQKGDSGYQSDGYTHWKQQDGFHYYDPAAAAPKDSFLAELLQCGSLSKAKTRYKELAKQYHPDLNPGKDTTVQMQQINVAWEKAQRML